MDLQRRSFIGKAAAIGALASTGLSRNSQAAMTSQTLPPPDPEVLTASRCSFGVTSDMLRQIRRMGRKKWLRRQLNWKSIDDSALEEQLHRQTPTIYMSIRELAKIESNFRVANQLNQATLLRAMFSHRQLYEVMVEFWSNHFSIYHRDGPVSVLKTVDDREVIRPHALGNFRKLLHASSKSPAMLLYLDNHTNVAGTPNENYARELMELHTLGVDGGYTETDVQEVARCFTGWALGREGRKDVGQFRFYPERHDQGEKTVLGHHIPPQGGIRDGEQVIDILAGHPSTARFISTKLARHFISDSPPAELIERMSKIFLGTDGDIRALLEEILFSEEFLTSADEKLKRPIDFILGALRVSASGVQRQSYSALVNYLLALGQIPFDWVPPDGYPDTAAYWISTNGMLNRWNFASSLSGSRLPGISIDYAALCGNSTIPGDIVDTLTARLLHRPLREEHRHRFIEFLAGGNETNLALSIAETEERVPALIGLMLSSPYFQYR